MQIEPLMILSKETGKDNGDLFTNYWKKNLDIMTEAIIMKHTRTELQAVHSKEW